MCFLSSSLQSHYWPLSGAPSHLDSNMSPRSSGLWSEWCLLPPATLPPSSLPIIACLDCESASHFLARVHAEPFRCPAGVAAKVWSPLSGQSGSLPTQSDGKSGARSQKCWLLNIVERNPVHVCRHCTFTYAEKGNPWWWGINIAPVSYFSSHCSPASS